METNNYEELRLILSIMSIFCLSAFAQQDNYEQKEYFGGYSFGLVDNKFDIGSSAASFFAERSPRNGFNVSAVYNTSRYFGVKGDVSATYNKGKFQETYHDPNLTYIVSGKNDSSLYNFLGAFR